MDISEPSLNNFTIYSKKDCAYCIKVKNLLKNGNFIFDVIECDEYIVKDKDFFLFFMEKKIGYPYNFFPMVFHNNKFIGGFTETCEYIEKLLLSFEDNF